MMRRYWVTEAAQEHVHVVRDKGYTQINTGPREPLENMKIGDWILYYSSTMFYQQPEPVCEQFTGISCVTGKRSYPQGGQFPDRWRRDVEFFHCNPHHPNHFINQVSFLQEQDDWKQKLLQPIFEIPRQDFIHIAQVILISTPEKILLY